MITDGLSESLDIPVIDNNEIDLDDGKCQISFIVGDIDPSGINSIGQSAYNFEMEIIIYVPASIEDSQLFAAGLSNKVCQLLESKYYGLNDQRQKPIIITNTLLKMKGNRDKKVSFVPRSVVFEQVVYLGKPLADNYSIEFGGVHAEYE